MYGRIREDGLRSPGLGLLEQLKLHLLNKYKPVIKDINKCVIKDVAVESWTGYSLRNPFKNNQDSYFLCKDLMENPSSLNPTSGLYEQEQIHLYGV